MSFLQPAMLLALPVIALPIIIHLINQRRFQTIRWGAMMFLLAANRMSRGYARVRQWLILAARTLAIAGLIFAVSRPLASGWAGLAAGGRVDTTIVLLDRSPSMHQQSAAGGQSKLQTGRQQLVHSLGMLPSNRFILIDSANNHAVEAESEQALAALMESGVSSASADVPAMLQTAYDYIRENRPSRTEVWICSDVRRHDWDAESGRWQLIRESFLELPQPVRFHLLAYAEPSQDDRSVRVTGVRRVETSTGAELLLSLRIEQVTPVEGTVTIPVQLEIDGARSEIAVEMTGTEADLQDHAIPVDSKQVRGWGRVSIPADSNLADNEFFFVFDRPAPRKTIIVCDDADATRPLAIAAGTSPEPGVASTVETLSPGQVLGSDWDQVALVLWQAALPQADVAEHVQAFLGRGGQIVFFPPQSPTTVRFAGVGWEEWTDVASDTPVTGWVGDQDLLSNAQSGASLPVGQLKVSRYCGISGEQTALATMNGGDPLLCRAVTDQRNVYFCATTVAESDSSLAPDGVVLYAMIQRALASGASSLGATRQYVAGKAPTVTTDQWRPLIENSEAVSTSYAVQAGVYGQGEQLFAINRAEQEDRPAIVPDARVAALFGDLQFDRVDDQAGSSNPLLEEVWRLLLALMMSALVAEALLCLPRIRNTAPPVGLPPRGAIA